MDYNSLALFNGSAVEYPEFCFDDFTEERNAYFLSHCHTDHLKGLDNVGWQCKIYCSELTKTLLISNPRYEHLSAWLLALPVGDVVSLTFKDRESNEDKVDVMLLPAGHCLGSTMFLLSGKRGIILYTGDFRLSRNQLPSFMNLFPKTIFLDTLYLDTTFYHQNWQEIPDRESATEAALLIIQNWLGSLGLKCLGNQLTGKCRLNLCLRTRFVYEHLLEKIADFFQVKICVDEETITAYALLSEETLKPFFCDDPSITWIHTCPKTKHIHYRTRREKLDGATPPSNELSESFTIYNLSPGIPQLTIIPTAIWFGLRQASSAGKQTSFAVLPDSSLHDRVVRIFYGSHSSASEVTNFVHELKPKKVVPCVVPPADTLTELTARLNQLVDAPAPTDQARNIAESELRSAEQTVGPLFTRFTELRRHLHHTQQATSTEQSVTDDISDSELLFDF